MISPLQFYHFTKDFLFCHFLRYNSPKNFLFTAHVLFSVYYLCFIIHSEKSAVFVVVGFFFWFFFSFLFSFLLVFFFFFFFFFFFLGGGCWGMGWRGSVP